MARGPCNKCEHSRPVKLPPGATLRPGQIPPLQCYRNPPQVVTIPRQGVLAGQMEIGVQAFYPSVDPNAEHGCFEPALTVDNSIRADRRRRD